MSNSKSRLAQYRHEAQHGKWVHPLTWRDTKQHHPSAYGAPRPNNVRGPEGQIYSDSIDQYGGDLGPAHKLFPHLIDHTGWHADNFQDELIIGHVIKLRTPRGTLYIPATRNTGCDGTVHYINDAESVPKGANEEEHEAAQREAARSADHYAQREAEEAREDNAKSMAEMHIEEAREEIHKINVSALALIREVKQQPAGFTPAICGALRDQISTHLAQRAKQFRLIAKREADYWSACPNY